VTWQASGIEQVNRCQNGISVIVIAAIALFVCKRFGEQTIGVNNFRAVVQTAANTVG
jgi:hypothetical protein